jgi:general secretion pathway protein D
LPALGQPAANTGGSGVVPPASANPTPKEQCLALTAQSKLALQKGDLINAKRWIDQALALKVADAEFASSTIKPRDVAMEVDRAMRLRGMDPKLAMAPSGQAPASPLANTSTSRVATAGAVSDQANAVQSGLYQPGSDPSKVAKASSQDSTVATDAGITGTQWYERGLEALARDDRETAKQCFANAWKKKDELDANARVQLKDKLAYLQSRTEPEAVSAIPTQDRESVQRKQRLFAEVSGEIADAERMVNDKPYEAIDRLKNLRTRVSQSDVDGAYRKQMLSMVDRVIGNVESWMETNRASIELEQRNKQIEDRISLDESTQAKEDSQIQTLVDQYNELMDDQRFAEAEVIARKVEEIKPNSEIAALMRGRSVIERRVAPPRNSKTTTMFSRWQPMSTLQPSSLPLCSPSETLTLRVDGC